MSAAATGDEPAGEAGGDMTMRDLCSIIEAELAGLSELAAGMQESLGHALQAMPDHRLCRREAQAFDLVTQRLDGMRTFFAHLRETMPESWLIRPSAAARQVVLGVLADRLSGREPAEYGHQAGNLELF